MVSPDCGWVCRVLHPRSRADSLHTRMTMSSGNPTEVKPWRNRPLIPDSNFNPTSCTSESREALVSQVSIHHCPPEWNSSSNAFLSFFSVHRDILDFLKQRNAALESDLLTVIFSVGPMSLIFLPKGFDYVIFFL